MKNSSRREKFVKLAEQRVPKAIKAIKLVGNLSNRSNYSYTDEDVRKILKALREELDDLKTRFESSKSAEEVIFKL